jgi:hypothetical protein
VKELVAELDLFRAKPHHPTTQDQHLTPEATLTTTAVTHSLSAQMTSPGKSQQIPTTM